MTRNFLTVLCLIGLVATPGSFQERVKETQSALFEINVDDKTGFIDRTGVIVIPPQFMASGYGTHFSEGLAPVYIKGQWCYINQKGSIVTRTKFDRVGPFSEGLARVGSNTHKLENGIKYGYIDRSGKVVIEPQFDETYGFSEGLGRVVIDGKWGFIDTTGRMVIPPQFLGAYWFSEGLASVALDADIRVYIDHTSRVVSDPQYEYTDAWFSDGLAPAKKGSRWGFVTKDWKFAIEPQYEYVAQRFSDGLAAVRLDGKYGFIDLAGKMVIEPRYDGPLIFSEGLAAFRVGGKYGYINKKGETVIEPQFSRAEDFRSGLAAVTSDETVNYLQCGCWDKWDYIDKTGRYIWRHNKVTPASVTSSPGR